MIVDAGLEFAMTQSDGTTATPMTHGATGTGTTAPTTIDTTLQTEVRREAFNDSGDPSTFRKFTEVYLDSTEANGNILAEYGLFNAGAAGTMLLRHTHTTFSKTVASEVLYFNWFDIERYTSADGLVVDDGLERTKQLIFGDDTNYVNTLSYGSDNTAPLATDTDLGVEIDKFDVDSVSEDNVDMELTFQHIWSPVPVYSWKETGLKCQDNKLTTHRTHDTITTGGKMYRTTYLLKYRNKT